jgi:RNA polymerase-binding transcription factor DksA
VSEDKKEVAKDLDGKDTHSLNYNGSPNYNDVSPYGISGKEGALDSTEVYDEAEIASALEAGFIAQALEHHRAKVAPEKHPDFDGSHCVDCDVEIPIERLNLGKVRCVDCQVALEKLNRTYRK